MAGNKAGGRAAAITNKAKYGFDFYAKIGAIGGAHGHTGGFAANRDLASIAGGLGGRMSRRGKYKTIEKERREIRRAYEELLSVHTKAMRERGQYKTAPSSVSRIDDGAITVFDRKRGLVLSDAA